MRSVENKSPTCPARAPCSSLIRVWKRRGCHAHAPSEPSILPGPGLEDQLSNVSQFLPPALRHLVLHLQLDPTIAARGVVTHSSGNHGQGLAAAAQLLGLPCTVVVPWTCPAVKMESMRESYGATVMGAGVCTLSRFFPAQNPPTRYPI